MLGIIHGHRDLVGGSLLPILLIFAAFKPRAAGRLDQRAGLHTAFQQLGNAGAVENLQFKVAGARLGIALGIGEGLFDSQPTEQELPA